MPDPITPESIRAYRESHGLSRLHLAARLLDLTPDQYAMVRQAVSLEQTIRLWETGVHPPGTKSNQYAPLLQRKLTGLETQQ